MSIKPNTAIVLVSHSSHLARGLQELIQAMASDVTVRTAAGNEAGELGTHAEAIFRAIDSTQSRDVLLFFDLGSALMNAEIALEMTEAEGKETNVTIVDAPLVEGAFAAAMAVQIGKNAAEARMAAEKTRVTNKRQ